MRAVAIIIIVLAVSVFGLYSYRPSTVPIATNSMTTAGTSQSTITQRIEVEGSLLVAVPSGVFISEQNASGIAKWKLLVEGTIRYAVLSPDRSLLAYVKNDNSSGVDAVFVLDLVKGLSKELFTLEKEDSQIFSSLDWSPDSSTMLYVTLGERHAMFIANMTAKPTMLLLARSAPYCLGSAYCPKPFEVFGELQGRWGTRDVIVVQQFDGPFPGTIGSTAGRIVPANRTYFLSIDRLPGTIVEVEPSKRWFVISAVLPGERAVLHDQNDDWFIVQSKYFREQNEGALVKIEACKATQRTTQTRCNPGIGFGGWPAPAPALSANGRNLALLLSQFEKIGDVWSAYPSNALGTLGTLNLESHQIESLPEVDAGESAAPFKQSRGFKGLAWAPSGEKLAILTESWEYSPGLSFDWRLSVFDKQTSRSVWLGFFPTEEVGRKLPFGEQVWWQSHRSLLAFAWIPKQSSSTSQYATEGPCIEISPCLTASHQHRVVNDAAAQVIRKTRERFGTSDSAKVVGGSA